MPEAVHGGWSLREFSLETTGKRYHINTNPINKNTHYTSSADDANFKQPQGLVKRGV